MEAVIFIGIQGGGKSHFYRERFFNSHVRISMDLLKTRARERRLLELCLQTQQPFVVDNTNVTVATRAGYIDAAKVGRFRVIGYYFEPNVAEALKRNEGRTGKGHVPKVAIFATLKRLQRPSLAEGFDELFRVTQTRDGTFVTEPWPQEKGAEDSEAGPKTREAGPHASASASEHFTS